MQRTGITIPVAGPLHELGDWLRELEELGYTDLWTAEADAWDGLTPLALAAAHTRRPRLGCAVLPVQTRGPALLAMSAASLCQAAPGRFALGIGASSPAIVERWNGIPYEKPYAHVRDTLRFLRRALAGERVREDYESFSVKGFRLGIEIGEPPRILVAALREGMLRLAGREGDGALLNWLSAGDVRTVAPIVRQFGADKEIAARIFVCPNPDAEAVRAALRPAANVYLNVPAYAAFQEWLGRGDLLAETWKCWREGRRREAAAAIPDRVLDELVVHGPPEACRERIREYRENGVDTPIFGLMPVGQDPREAARALAPGR